VAVTSYIFFFFFFFEFPCRLYLTSLTITELDGYETDRSKLTYGGSSNGLPPYLIVWALYRVAHIRKTGKYFFYFFFYSFYKKVIKSYKKLKEVKKKSQKTLLFLLFCKKVKKVKKKLKKYFPLFLMQDSRKERVIEKRGGRIL
jgi:hypothetical protein